MKTCLIGYGYWGKNILRNLVEICGPSNITVVERSAEKCSQLRAVFPEIRTFQNDSDAYKYDSFGAVVIATETRNHYQLAKKALLSGKHVLVEKPMTTSVVEAEELAAIAKAKNLTLMVDHIFLYHPVVRKMKDYFNAGFLGKISYIDSTRINLGIYQNDINVLWDLACHDISIVNYLVNESPNYIQAIGKINLDFGMEDIAYLFLKYPSGLLVHINSSWASPVKIRKMIIGGEKRMIIYDDIEPSNKLTIFEYAQSFSEDGSKSPLTDYRLGNIIIPKYENKEPLRSLLTEFFDCITTGNIPLSDSKSAIEVIRILEKAQESLSSGGVKIQVD